jgi:hypothetical protein
MDGEYIERTTISDAEKIRLLRDALKKCQVVINRTNDWDSAVADAYNTAHEVLEATRE